MKHSVWILTVFMLMACGVPKQAVKPNSYDFGQLPKGDIQNQPASKSVLIIPAIKTPENLSGSSVFYRLLYITGNQLLPYANSQWTMPPAALITERLRHRLSAQVNVLTNGDVIHGRMLKVELLQFEQDFDTAKTSHAVVTLRASLIQDGKLILQHTFEQIQPAKTADSEGGIAALAVATDQSVEALTIWLKAVNE